MRALEGKVAIVTGGARGIGRSESLLLAREGAAVVVNDLGGSWDGTGEDDRPAQLVVEEIAAAGGEAAASFDDVAEWEGGQRLVQQAIDAYGRLDVLVCNAGNVRDRMLFNLSEEEWDSVVRVHLKGHFVPTRFAAAHWRERAKSSGKPADGRIVYTASEAGLHGLGRANYSAAKGGIVALGLTAAHELSRYGVTANVICPRARTRMAEAAFGDFDVPQTGFDQWHPDNVAAWVVYLAGDDAREISGQTFCVGGGAIELMQGWRCTSKVERDEAWTPEALKAARLELFEGRSTGPPPLPRLEILDSVRD